MFWIREIAGWGLVAFSLFLIQRGLSFASTLDQPRVIEGASIMLTGVLVMRAGILLIRISTAARICQLDQGATRNPSK